MNKFIFEQLGKVKFAQVPEFDNNTTKLVIKKGALIQDKVEEDIMLDHYYKITVADYIVHPYENFTLHTNWNNGKVPTDSQMNCEIIQKMGKMIKVEAVGVNDQKSWCGWLPRKSVLTFEEIK